MLLKLVVKTRGGKIGLSTAIYILFLQSLRDLGSSCPLLKQKCCCIQLVLWSMNWGAVIGIM